MAQARIEFEFANSHALRTVRVKCFFFFLVILLSYFSFLCTHQLTLKGVCEKSLLEVVQHQAACQQHGRGVGDVLVCDALPGVSCSLKYTSQESRMMMRSDTRMHGSCFTLSVNHSQFQRRRTHGRNWHRERGRALPPGPHTRCSPRCRTGWASPSRQTAAAWTPAGHHRDGRQPC